MKTTKLNNITSLSGILIFLAALFFFFTKTNLSLIYHWQQSIALPFSAYLTSPAGIAKYLSVYTLDILHAPIAGILILLLIFLIQYFSLTYIFRNWKNRPCFHPLIILALTPSAILVAFYTFPMQHLISITLGLILATSLSALNNTKSYIKIFLSTLIAFLAFLSAGLIGLVIIIQIPIIQIFTNKHKQDNILTILLALLTPFLFLLLNSTLSLPQIFFGQFILEDYYQIPKIAYLAFSNILALFILIKIITLFFPEYNSSKTLRPKLLAYLLVLAILNAATLTSINTNLKKSLTLEQAALNYDWDLVLEQVDDDLITNRIILLQVNRALYHKGQLLDKLFHYPQSYGEQAIFLDDNRTSRLSLIAGAIYLDMGYANEGRHWSNEAHSGAVYHPIVLKQLIIAHCAIGDMELAKKYLKTLSRSRIYRDWTSKYLDMIADGSINKNPQIRYLRINNPDTEFFAGTNQVMQKLSAFYENNQDNKMALEYLVATHLLKHNIGKVIQLIPQFKELNYEKLPRAVEEAILMYMSNQKTMNVNLASYTISTKTFDDFKDLSAKMKNATSKEQAQRLLANYRHTYWHYVLFTSPYSK